MQVRFSTTKFDDIPSLEIDHIIISTTNMQSTPLWYPTQAPNQGGYMREQHLL